MHCSGWRIGRYNDLFDHLVGARRERPGNHQPDRLRRLQLGGGATTNSGVSMTLALMEFAMKQWASTLSMVLRAGSSSASLLRVTRGRIVTSVMWYFPSTFSSGPSASLSYPTGVRSLARASVRNVSIIHVLSEPTSSSS